jgi:hypothetical protein
MPFSALKAHEVPTAQGLAIAIHSSTKTYSNGVSWITSRSRACRSRCRAPVPKLGQRGTVMGDG